MSAVPAMRLDDLPGSVIAGRFLVQDWLGRGGNGVVYAAKDLATGRHVALKFLDVDADDTERAARLIREGKAMSLFHHRNIVELVELGTLDDGRAFLATEQVLGVSLRAVVDDGLTSPERALAIVRQVLAALDHAHALGVVHRDIKPENIMLVDGGCPEAGTDLVKVLDFGVAKLLGDTAAVLGEGKLTQTGMTCFGTPLYMAPESAFGGEVDARADLYAVGVILFELLTGAPPFEGSDPAAALRLHAAAPVPTLAERAPGLAFTPALELLVAEALAKRPEHRFASAAEMIAAVDAALASLLPTPELGSELVPVHATIPCAIPPMISAPQALPHVADTVMDSWTSFERPAAPRWRRYLPVLGIVIGVVTCGVASRGGEMRSRSGSGSFLSKATMSERARHGAELAAVTPDRAVEWLEAELVGAHDDAHAHLVLGHARFAIGRPLDALAAYERATMLSPRLGEDPYLRSNVLKAIEGRDTAAAMVALELLASRVSPPAQDTVAAQASRGKRAEVRRRAAAIAERDGFADRIERVESWSLDLAQTTDCAARRAIVRKLRDHGDPRALPALRRARAARCVSRAANEAIAALEAAQT